MPANTNPIFVLTAVAKGTTIVNSDGTTKKSLVTGGTNGTRIDHIPVSSDDTAAVDLAWWLNDGVTDFYLGNTRIAAGSGYTTIARVDAIATLSPTLGYLFIPSSYILKVNAVAAVTSGKTVTIVATGGDY